MSDNANADGAQGAGAKAPRLRRLRISDVSVGNRLLDINEDNVLALMNSITDVGLIHPIAVSYYGRGINGRGSYGVNVGAHRLEAHKRLGLEEIDAVIIDLPGRKGMLAEIDENLIRRDLTDAECAKLTAERKRIYELDHPETKHGGDRKGSSRQNGDLKRFTKGTAKKTGRSERSVQRAAARGEALGPDVLDKVKGTVLDKGTELDALAKLPEEEQRALAERAKAGEQVSAKPKTLTEELSARAAPFGLRIERHDNTFQLIDPNRSGISPITGELVSQIWLIWGNAGIVGKYLDDLERDGYNPEAAAEEHAADTDTNDYDALEVCHWVASHRLQTIAPFISKTTTAAVIKEGGRDLVDDTIILRTVGKFLLELADALDEPPSGPNGGPEPEAEGPAENEQPTSPINRSLDIPGFLLRTEAPPQNTPALLTPPAPAPTPAAPPAPTLTPSRKRRAEWSTYRPGTEDDPCWRQLSADDLEARIRSAKGYNKRYPWRARKRRDEHIEEMKERLQVLRAADRAELSSMQPASAGPAA